jgi:hypothetical protein
LLCDRSKTGNERKLESEREDAYALYGHRPAMVDSEAFEQLDAKYACHRS